MKGYWQIWVMLISSTVWCEVGFVVLLRVELLVYGGFKVQKFESLGFWDWGPGLLLNPSPMRQCFGALGSKNSMSPKGSDVPWAILP